ncbi:lysozyme inhibitor LprI family protein [Burkholderia sp. LMG 32019]|uniref:lysozyme inhibitor LprI family protein n=1 Tax=Burkholderia sp. LMG 32019 TaxID=3158173 RepID=UPI003C2B4BAD
MTGKLMVTLVLALTFCTSAFAEDSYRLVGAARVYSIGSSRPNLELPANPAYSSVLTLKNDSFYLNYDGSTPNECGVPIKKKMPFSFDSAPLGTAQKLNKFLEDKFHTNANGWTQIYLLGDATSPRCTALRFSKIYASNDEIALLDESFLYLFKIERSHFRDVSKGFDCALAKTNVEHLICGDPQLKKMDADVSYGFVLMQRRYSKEISYQDPVKMEQIKWISTVRNKCTTADCLTRVYASRIDYIKGKVIDSYPSHPNPEKG